MCKAKIQATAWATLATALLAGLIVLGSNHFAHFDAVLVGYTFATLFAVFGVTRRYALWLQRPPTAMYWRRGRRVFLKLFHPRHVAWNLVRVVQRSFGSE